MARLRIMGRSGDTQVTWDPNALETHDPDGLRLVREAERIVDDYIRNKGVSAFAVDLKTNEAKKLERFDPYADEIMIALPLAGC